MKPEIELKLLQEIEDSSEPVFGIFPDHDKYDQNKKFIESMRLHIPGDVYDIPEQASDEEPFYICFHTQNHERYLRSILPNLIHEGKTFFEIGPLRDYGQNRTNGIFLI